MIYLAAALVAVVALLGVALYRQQVNHLNHLSALWVKAENERKSLLDRIQHPTIRQVDASPAVPPEVPRDAGEMAQIGQIVPEFVHVGTEMPEA